MCRVWVIWLFCLFVHMLTDYSNASVTSRVTDPPDHRLEECIAESKADRNSVYRLKTGHWKRSDAALKKWALCYLVKRGVMSRNGVLNQDVVLRDIPPKDKGTVEKIINKCLYKKAHDPVETAWHYLTCFHARGPKYAKHANRI